MDEAAYRHHCEQAKRAESLYQTLRELYGNDIDKQMLFFRARFDKVITDEERWLLRDYTPIG